jgi:phage-related protein
MKRQIVFYKTKDNKCPIQDFLDNLSGKVSQKVIWVIKLLEDLDIIPINYFKKIVGTKEIWECRIKLGSDSYRILCFFMDKSVIVITHGFVKKSKKVPKNEIERAESLMEDFNRRRKYE